MISSKDGPDRGWSWVVAIACFFSSLVLAGIFRTSGVLFVAFIHSFGVTREEASWPMVLCISVLNLTGPFSGILGQKFGARPVIMTGAVIATIGISSCFLTASLNVITLLFGGIFGIGWGFMNTLMPGVLNAYFLNLRATANGIANSGSCFGSLILPLVFEHFISTYGLAGCFLLTGGIVLNITVLGALMRPPPWLKIKKLPDTDVKYSYINSSKGDVKIELKDRSIELSKTENTAQKSIKVEFEAENSVSPSKPLLNQTLQQEESHKLQHELETDLNQQLIHSPVTSTLKSEMSVLHAAGEPTAREKTATEKIKIEKLNSASDISHERIPEDESKSMLTIFNLFVTVLMCPMFYITAITNVSFYFLYHMYVVIIVDFALDRNIPAENAKDMLFAFSIADLFGRLCFGWITDRKYATRSKFVMICMIMIGIVFFLFPFSKNYWSLMASSCGYGLLLGCTMVIFPILLVDFCGIELHAVSYGCMCFMNGFASFGRPFLIGYFRDHVGSYSNMFYVLGGISTVASLLWLLESLFVKNDKLSHRL